MALSFPFIEGLKKTAGNIDEKIFDRHFCIQLDCNTLAAIEKGVYIQTVLKDFFAPLNKISGPSLYWFEIISNHTPQEIIATVKSAAASDTKRKFPRLRQLRKEDANTKILYVGKSLGIAKRMVSHLGYHSKEDNHGLQLCHWAKGIGLQLQLHCIVLPATVGGFLDYFEFELAKYFNPIIGKRRF